MVPRVVKQLGAAAFSGVVLLVAGTACGEEPIQPATLDDKPPAVEPIRSGEPTPTETPEEDPTPTKTYEPVDVCTLVTAKEVEKIFKRGKVPTVEEPEGEPIAVPGASATYRCGFRWEPGDTSEILTISVLRHTGTSNAQDFIDAILVDAEPVGSVGDVASIDLKQTFGNQTAALVSAKQTEDGISGLMILGPQQAGVSAFAELARKVFAQL